jgi:type II secretory pathway component PulF
MPKYKYRAKRGPEEVVEGVIEAETEDEAVAKIDQLGLVAVSVDQESPKLHLEAVPAGKVSLVKVRSKDITIFSRQLSSLLKSGVPLLRSLSIIKEQTQNPRLKAIVGELAEGVKKGVHRLSEVMSFYPNVFDPIYIAMVKSGEESGALEEIFARIFHYRRKHEEFLSHLRTATAYPILILIVE